MKRGSRLSYPASVQCKPGRAEDPLPRPPPTLPLPSSDSTDCLLLPTAPSYRLPPLIPSLVDSMLICTEASGMPPPNLWHYMGFTLALVNPLYRLWLSYIVTRLKFTFVKEIWPPDPDAHSPVGPQTPAPVVPL